MSEADFRAIIKAGTGTSAWPGRNCGGYGVQQSPFEFSRLCDFLRKRKCKRYLEIGLYMGGNWTLLSERLKFTVSCGITLPGGPLRFQPSEGFLHLGDSASPEALEFAEHHGPFDFVLVDGDHRYEAALRDYRNYRELTRYIGMHDITGLRRCEGVMAAWAEIKQEAEVLEEIIDADWPVGIGIVRGGL